MKELLVVGVNGHTQDDTKKEMTKSFVSWQRLASSIADLVRTRHDEKVIGYTITEDGINVSIGTKE
jgi:hypothetical protein